MVLTLIYLGLVGAVVYYGGKAQAIDPMDPYLQVHLKENKPVPTNTLYQYFNHPLEASEQSSEGDTMKQCWLCDTQVRQKSMHCKFCNKCVDEFDHHCMCKFSKIQCDGYFAIWSRDASEKNLVKTRVYYSCLQAGIPHSFFYPRHFTGLNTCIGKRNYSYFYRTMLALFSMLSLHFILSLALIISSYNDNAATELRIQNWGSDSLQDPTRAIHAILIFFLLFDVVSLFLVGQLIWFHVGLQKEGLSTYEYIVRDHERKREQARLDAELSTLRVRRINKAKHEGNQVLATRLAIGGYCRKTLGCAACDPMEVPVSANVEAASSVEQGFSFALGTVSVEVDDGAGCNDIPEQIMETGAASHENGITFIEVSEGDSINALPQHYLGAAVDHQGTPQQEDHGEGFELMETVGSFSSTDEPEPPHIKAVSSPSAVACSPSVAAVAVNDDAPSDEEE